MAHLAKWLNEEKIQFLESVPDWQTAIEAVARPLLQEQAISQRYVDTIIQQKQDIGPYFVIAPRIAMPHARPEQGAEKLGLSVLKLAQGVNFDADENDPVDILFMFAAPDSNSHIEMITQLAEVLSDEEKMAQVLSAANQAELSRLLLS
ncbi:PTS sugar transporter subunit IIA [Pantoea sp. Acro-805]|uniref:PTS sugar transporter subunit IIA n=1 Tax=Candidatus Pantoea formicae TaxID=2608355 RepID=A0ABX0R6W4_9GAMM|nr:PTS sugar transporter subunit IIA [Pantoea formicae]NIF03026.1 PTS sugar transporter subunit IIA [Pantoea formicae]